MKHPQPHSRRRPHHGRRRKRRTARRRRKRQTAGQVEARNNSVSSQQSLQVGEGPDPREIAAFKNCRLPKFWKENPSTWFDLVEATFVLHGISGDTTKNGLVLSMLGPDELQEVADILRHPPVREKYKTVKDALLARLSLSADR